MSNSDIPKIADPDWLAFGESGMKTDLRATSYNRWRASLPDSCWYCYKYQRCSPNVQCLHNPNRKRLER